LDQLETLVNDHYIKTMLTKRPPSYVVVSNGDFSAEMSNPVYNGNWYRERRPSSSCMYSIDGEIQLYRAIPTLKQQMMRECGLATPGF